MKVVGSIIARLGSKRLAHKNLMPFHGMPLVGYGIRLLERCKRLDVIVVSTEDELIAGVAHDFGARVVQRPVELSADDTPSVPVFRHIAESTDCTKHVNFNINYPTCSPQVIDDAVDKLETFEEVLTVPHAVWGQTRDCLENYGDPWKITAHPYRDERVGPIDIHKYDDILEAYRQKQGDIKDWDANQSAHSTES